MKKLVVFYSLSGNTKRIAMKIARALRADIIEVQTVKDYPDDFDVLSSLAKKEIESGYLPQIRPMEINLSHYGAVILGTPVWWNAMAPAMKKFISGYKWNGVNVYPFSTYNGKERGLGKVATDFKKSARGANFAEMLNVKFDEKMQLVPDNVILDWLLELE